MKPSELLYNIAITKIDSVGPILGKSLISYCGSSEAVFLEKKHRLMKIPGVGEHVANQIIKSDALVKAEEEMKFIDTQRIEVLFYLNEKYPSRLKHYPDAPILLYFRGNINLNAERVVSIVGTRRITEYGKQLTQQLIKSLQPYGVLIVSGLAHGVDTTAHKNSLQEHMNTVGVLAHGLDRIYPQENYHLAEKMTLSGGLLTEFPSNTNPDRENFPMRNRIVAGMADAVVIVETKRDGGSMITAEYANEYNKDVFAYPGRVGDTYSSGCLHLLKNNKASLIETGEDLIQLLRWDQDLQNATRKMQKELFIDFTEDEEIIINLIKQYSEPHIDQFHQHLNFTPGELASHLLNLEFKNAIRSLPGKKYTLTI